MEYVIWVKSTTDNTTNSAINGIFADKSGNIYTTGYYQGAQLNLNNISLLNSSPGTQEMFVARYDSLGTVKWARSIIGFGNDQGKSVVGDNKGNLYFTGMFSGNYLNSDDLFVINNAINSNDISTFRLFDSQSVEVITSNMSLNKKLNFKYYPNPFRDFVSIEIPQNLADVELQVFNNLGQKLAVNFTTNNDKLVINTSQFVKGMYYFKLIGNNKVLDSKVLIAE